MLRPRLSHKFIMFCKSRLHYRTPRKQHVWIFFFLFRKGGGCKGCASVKRQRSKKGGRRKKRTGWRDMKERNPHPSLFLYALTGKYLNYQTDSRNTLTLKKVLPVNFPLVCSVCGILQLSKKKKKDIHIT